MKTVLIDVSEAKDAVLDFLVWKIEHGSKDSNKMSDDELLAALNPYYHPSTNWAQGGLIVDREISFLEKKSDNSFCAGIRRKDMKNGGWRHGYGQPI